MARRITRKRLHSKFRIGQRVAGDGDYNGDYFGTVVRQERVTKPASSHDPALQTHAGTIVLVDRWEGSDFLGSDRFEIQAWDSETRSVS
mgnify:FL=1